MVIDGLILVILSVWEFIQPIAVAGLYGIGFLVLLISIKHIVLDKITEHLESISNSLHENNRLIEQNNRLIETLIINSVNK